MKELKDISITRLYRTKTIRPQADYQYEDRDRGHFGLLLCKKGKLTFYHKGKEIICDPKHPVFLPRKAAYRICGNKPGFFGLIEFDCTEEFRAEEFHCFRISDPESYMKDYEQIQYLSLLSQNRMQIMSMLYGMLGRLINEDTDEHDILAPAIKYLEQHYMDMSLSIAVLAQAAHISTSYFHKLFRRCFAMTPGEYILGIRIHKAKLMLVESEKTVAAIAEACGFTNVYHFSRVFKANAGVSPTQYRKLAETVQI